LIPGWEVVDVIVKPMGYPNPMANITIRPSETRVVMTIDPMVTPRELNQVVLHELVHPIIIEYTNMIRTIIEEIAPPTSVSTYFKLMHIAEEKVVDQIVTGVLKIAGLDHGTLVDP